MGQLDAEEHRLLDKLSDHDLIVSLHIKVNRLIDDGADHEKRLRKIEGGYISRTFGMWLLGAAIGAATALGTLMSALRGK